MSESLSKGVPNKTTPITINRPRLSGGGDNYVTPTVSPSSEHHFLIPSPMVTRRTRTFSACRRATEGPVHKGICKHFSRSRGHGFIQPDEGFPTELVFMHVSDIESDYVPLEGDILSYQLTKIPPKMEKFQAVNVRIAGLCIDNNQQHERWDGGK